VRDFLLQVLVATHLSIVTDVLRLLVWSGRPLKPTTRDDAEIDKGHGHVYTLVCHAVRHPSIILLQCTKSIKYDGYAKINLVLESLSLKNKYFNQKFI
jgi:hypothetical protein